MTRTTQGIIVAVIGATSAVLSAIITRHYTSPPPASEIRFTISVLDETGKSIPRALITTAVGALRIDDVADDVGRLTIGLDHLLAKRAGTVRVVKEGFKVAVRAFDVPQTDDGINVPLEKDRSVSLEGVQPVGVDPRPPMSGARPKAKPPARPGGNTQSRPLSQAEVPPPAESALRAALDLSIAIAVSSHTMEVDRADPCQVTIVEKGETRYWSFLIGQVSVTRPLKIDSGHVVLFQGRVYSSRDSSYIPAVSLNFIENETDAEAIAVRAGALTTACATR